MTKKFNPRVCGVVVQQGRVLLSRPTWDAFWALPGGRIELGEFSDVALRREIEEELGIERFELGRLMFVAETLFTYGKIAFHELGFYYEVLLPADAVAVRSGEFAGAEPDLVLKWFDLDALATVDLRPAFLRVSLIAPPAGLTHLRIDELPESRS